jgi:hypothetical protein
VGDHVVTGSAGEALTLRWGDGLARPGAPPPGPLFDPL